MISIAATDISWALKLGSIAFTRSPTWTIKSATCSGALCLVETELYDVQVIPAVQKPMALGFQTDEIAQLITLEL